MLTKTRMNIFFELSTSFLELACDKLSWPGCIICLYSPSVCVYILWKHSKRDNIYLLVHHGSMHDRATQGSVLNIVHVYCVQRIDRENQLCMFVLSQL